MTSEIQLHISNYRRTLQFVCRFESKNITIKSKLIQYDIIRRRNDRDQIFISGSWDQSFMVWNIFDFTLKKKVSAHSDFISSMIRTDKYLITGGCDKFIKVWEINNNFELMKSYLAHKGYVYSLIIYRESILVSGGGDNVINIWDIKKDFLLINTLSDHTGFIYAMFIDNDLLYTCSSDLSVKVWNLTKFELVKTLTGGDSQKMNINAVGVVNNHVYCGGDSGYLTIWSISNKEYKQVFIKNLENTILCSKVYLNYACIGGRSILKLFDSSNNFELYKSFDINLHVRSICFKQDQYLIAGCNNSSILVFDFLKSTEISRTLKNHSSDIKSLV